MRREEEGSFAPILVVIFAAAVGTWIGLTVPNIEAQHVSFAFRSELLLRLEVSAIAFAIVWGAGTAIVRGLIWRQLPSGLGMHGFSYEGQRLERDALTALTSRVSALEDGDVKARALLAESVRILNNKFAALENQVNREFEMMRIAINELRHESIARAVEKDFDEDVDLDGDNDLGG